MYQGRDGVVGGQGTAGAGGAGRSDGGGQANPAPFMQSFNSTTGGTFKLSFNVGDASEMVSPGDVAFTIQ